MYHFNKERGGQTHAEPVDDFVLCIFDRAEV